MLPVFDIRCLCPSSPLSWYCVAISHPHEGIYLDVHKVDLSCTLPWVAQYATVRAPCFFVSITPRRRGCHSRQMMHLRDALGETAPNAARHSGALLSPSFCQRVCGSLRSLRHFQLQEEDVYSTPPSRVWRHL
ncbi:unnamed protein product, partial [Ectocarpus sp. 8 AP-2014]